MDENSSFLKLPDIEGAEYLIALLGELGFVSHTGMGATHITWTEIKNWLDTTELELSVWEKLLLKEMSEVYASELSQASAKDYPAPYTAPVDEVVDLVTERKAVDSKLRNVFSSFKRNKN